MGCGSSAMSKERFKLSESSFVTLKALAKRFDLKRSDLEKFRVVFAAIDGTVEFFESAGMSEQEGYISAQEFLIHFQLDNTPFSRRVFSVMDVDDSGKIDFCEFVMTLYSYCTHDWHGLVDFAFDLVDSTKDDELSFAELRELIEVVYGHELDETCEKVLAKIDKNHDDKISRHEFHMQSRKFPVLLFPAFHVQDMLQETVMGHHWWTKQCDRLRHDKVVMLQNDEKAGTQENVIGVMAALREEAAVLRASEKAAKKAAREANKAEKKANKMGKKGSDVAGGGQSGEKDMSAKKGAKEGEEETGGECEGEAEAGGGGKEEGGGANDAAKTKTAQQGEKAKEQGDHAGATKEAHGKGGYDKNGVWREEGGEYGASGRRRHSTLGKGAAVRKNKYETNATRDHMHHARADVTKLGLSGNAHEEHRKHDGYATLMANFDEREALAAARQKKRVKEEKAAEKEMSGRHGKRLAHARMQSVKNLLHEEKGMVAQDPHSCEKGIPHSHHHKKWRPALAKEGSVSAFIGGMVGSEKKKVKKKRRRHSTSVGPDEPNPDMRADRLDLAAKSAATIHMH